MNLAELIRNDQLEELSQALDAKPTRVNQPDERGFTPLVLATYLGKKAIVELLIAKGADLNAQDPVMGNTALMGVCFKGSTDLAKLLLEKGADASLKNKQGETALDFARRGSFEEIVVILTKV